MVMFVTIFELEKMEKFEFSRKHVRYIYISLVVIVFSLVLMWYTPPQEIKAVLFFPILFSIFTIVEHRNETRYIAYDSARFVLMNQFVFGKNFTAHWKDLELLQVQDLSYSFLFIRRRYGMNVIFQFKGHPLVALADDSTQYREFIIQMVKDLSRTSAKEKVSHVLLNLAAS